MANLLLLCIYYNFFNIYSLIPMVSAFMLPSPGTYCVEPAVLFSYIDKVPHMAPHIFRHIITIYDYDHHHRAYIRLDSCALARSLLYAIYYIHQFTEIRCAAATQVFRTKSGAALVGWREKRKHETRRGGTEVRAIDCVCVCALRLRWPIRVCGVVFH